jgi:uncharacterized membrane protein YeaQ/YmgE (transglycosylase-associated protein family)
MSSIADFLFRGDHSPNLLFIAFLILGVSAAWVMAFPPRWDGRSAVMSIVGVSGAWFGAEVARLFGQAPQGGAEQFLAALIGALGLAYVWGRLNPPNSAKPASLPDAGEMPR